MGSGMIPKMIVEWNVEGRRRKGIGNSGWTEEGAEDRDAWRSKISLD